MIMNRSYQVPAAAALHENLSILTGSISIVSSIANMAMIYITQEITTLSSSIYNRIVFGISVFSTISATAIVIPIIISRAAKNDHDNITFTSLTHYDAVNASSTCATQGFFVFLGSRGAGFYCCGLSLFYLCSIYMHMEADKIKKYVEPYIHAISILFPLLLSALLVYWDSFPAVLYSSCWNSPATTVYPFEYSSIFDDKHECMTKDTKKNKTLCFIDSMIIVCMLLFFSSSLAMVIIWTHIDKPGARSFFLLRRKQYHFGNKELSRIQKVLTFQASLHIIAFLLPWVSILQQQIYHSTDDRHQQSSFSPWLIHTFFPLQGFLNSSIYFYHKVYLVRRCNKYHDITICDAFWHVLSKPKQIPEFHLEGMEVVHMSYSACSKRQNCSTIHNDEVSNTGAEYYDSKHSTAHESLSELIPYSSSTSTNKDDFSSDKKWDEEEDDDR